MIKIFKNRAYLSRDRIETIAQELATGLVIIYLEMRNRSKDGAFLFCRAIEKVMNEITTIERDQESGYDEYDD